MSICWYMLCIYISYEKARRTKAKGIQTHSYIFSCTQSSSFISAFSPSHWCIRVTLQSSRGMPLPSCSNSPTTTNQTFLPQLRAVPTAILVCCLRSTLIHKNESELQGPRIANPWPSAKDKPRKSGSIFAELQWGLWGLSCSLSSLMRSRVWLKRLSATADHASALRWEEIRPDECGNYVVSLGKWWRLADYWYS